MNSIELEADQSRLHNTLQDAMSINWNTTHVNQSLKICKVMCMYIVHVYVSHTLYMYVQYTKQAMGSKTAAKKWFQLKRNLDNVQQWA